MPRQVLQTAMVELLDSDPRPTFIVSLNRSGSIIASSSIVNSNSRDHKSQPREIIYHNKSLKAYPHLVELLVSEKPESHQEFWEWISSSSRPASASAAAMKTDYESKFEYLNLTWTKSVVEDLWVVVGANDDPPSSEPPRKVRQQQMRQDSSPKSMSSSPGGKVPHAKRALGKEASHNKDIKDLAPQQIPFLDVVHSVQWDETPIGPLDRWPQGLRRTFRQIISDSRPIAIYWGKTLTTVYNEAFSKLCGSKHPQMLGQPAANVWAESDFFQHVVAQMSGRGNKLLPDTESGMFVVSENEPLVETYVRWSLVPIVEADECLGYMLPILETTSTRLWERRMKMLIELGDQLVTARDVKSYWRKTIEQLDTCDPTYDIPLAILYSVHNEPTSSTCDMSDGCSRVCYLEGALGVPPGHEIAPQRLCPEHTDDGMAPMFREMFQTRQAMLLEAANGTLPPHLLQGLQWRGFGDACQAAVLCPITPTREENVMGLLVLGLNPRRPYDYDYQQYVSLLHQKLTTSLASTVLLEEETRRGRNAAQQAAYGQAMLKEKLAKTKQEASESMGRFKAVAEFIPVGMCFGDQDSNITFANDAWYRIMGHPVGSIAPGAFERCVMDEDVPLIARAYRQLESVPSVTFSFRVKRGRNSPRVRHMSPLTGGQIELGEDVVLDDGVERHVLASAKAERGTDGAIINILTCLTDVTAHKLAAEEAVRKAQEAENLKRMAELATVGMYNMSVDGRLVNANNVFYELCGIPKVDDLTKKTVRPWETCVVEDDRPALKGCLEQLVQDGQTQTAELRLKTRYTVDDGKGNKIDGPRWVMATFMPVMTLGNVLHSITGCLSDVSAQKWQLEVERERKEQALESKRQQENFIDMTSHEMRNPLGAILHCADAIAAALAKVQDIHGSTPMTPGASQAREPSEKTGSYNDDEGRLVDECIDSAETIIACAQHQKRIVDDILTMSKLDSKLLSVTPCTVDPINIAEDALKMCELEARRVDVDLQLNIDASFHELGLNFLDFDPSRVQQVLINLLTNAVKFTKSSAERRVEVTVKTSRQRPTDAPSLVQFMPRSCNKESEHPQLALVGRSNPIYLTFEVKDSGKGLGEGEMRNLFRKFRQATEKTHVKYGGSGLGLFISRRLTELQNGAIGVSSQKGVGSVFAFFIEAYVPTEASRKEAEAAAEAAQAATSSEVPPEVSVIPSTPPTAQGSQQQQQQQPGHHHQPAPPPERQNPGANSRIDGILIVEDNIINQQITRRGLTDRGFSVDVANHGIEALEKLEESRRRANVADSEMSNASTSSSATVAAVTSAAPSPGPMSAMAAPAAAPPGRASSRGRRRADSNPGRRQQTPQRQQPPTATSFNLVLMDIEMPVQDGLTCTRRIRQLERQGQTFGEGGGGRIPIIAVSANARPEQIAEAKRAGCDDVLVKPYRMHELVEKMQMVIRRMDGLSPNSPPR